MNGPWVEKYRPQTLEEVVGQDHIIHRLKQYINEANMPNLMFTGPDASASYAPTATTKRSRQFTAGFSLAPGTLSTGLLII